MDRAEFEDKFRLLEESAMSLVAHLKAYRPQFEGAIDGTLDLPEECPSYEAMAQLIFGKLEMDLVELEWITERVRKALIAGSGDVRPPSSLPAKPHALAAQT